MAVSGERAAAPTAKTRARAKRKRKGSTTVGSGSVVLARLRVTQSGLGRAGRWLVQAVAVATAAAKVIQGFAMGGENEVTKKILALPGLNNIQTAAEESFSINFRYFSEFELSLLHHLQIEFPVVKY